MATPECPPPPYPGLGLENPEISRYQRCDITPPPAYHNMIFNAGPGDDVMSSSISERTIRSVNTGLHVDIHDIGGIDFRGDIQADQSEGRENEGFVESDTNNNKNKESTARQSTASPSSSAVVVVPLLGTTDVSPSSSAAVVVPLLGTTDVSPSSYAAVVVPLLGTTDAPQVQELHVIIPGDGFGSYRRETLDENNLDGESEPMVVMRDVPLANEPDFRDSAGSETGLIR
jgi:hypothetical protein